MSTTAVQNLLDSRILGNGEVITYRFVARELKLSADDAKLALKTYMGACDKELWATYILAGDDINGHRKFVLVPQEALEVTKAQFATVSNVHVYSLSSAPRKDASMIAQAARALRRTNAKPKPGPARAAPVAAKPAETAVAKPAATMQKKPTGKLDWSKAKSKTAPKPVEEKPKPAAAAAKKETKPVAVKKEPKPATVPKPAPAKEEPQPAPPKAEVKAKAPPKQPSPEPEASDEDVRPMAGGSRLKRRVIVSDDEDDEPPEPVARLKRKIRESDDEDDEDDEMEVDEPGDLYEDTEPEVKPQRKRQVKTSVPIGSNGRPKKRVIKERMFKDEQGYMQSEDYSTYETDHDEPKEPEKPKPKAKESKPKEPKAKPAPAAAKPKPAPKKVAGKPGQAKLTNFLKK